MDNIYDLVIVGAGPAGLALSQMCSKSVDVNKILVIDKELSIGGCHRVRRVDNLFTEHGPRVISDTYVVFKKLLNEMNINFYDLFTKYNFNISEIGNETIFSTLSISEISKLLFAFIILIVNDNYGKDIILYDYIISFKDESKEIINRICKLTDGGGSDKFTLNEFLQIFNQQYFYNLYQPKLPNDIGLFKIWKTFLESKNVDFLLNSNITNINIYENKIVNIQIETAEHKKLIYGKKFVLAIPPKNLFDIITKFNIPHSLDNLETFSKETQYIDYISIVFHWDTILNLKKVYGFPKSAWGIAFTVLSDYMPFTDTRSKTVISTAITLTNAKSLRINKTANEITSKEELINEVFNQLLESFKELPSNVISIMSPGVEYDKGQWICKDTAFINTTIHKKTKEYIPFNCGGGITNLYNLGTHNGKSLYKFTSLESAVSNGVYLSDILYPDLKNRDIITKTSSLTDFLTVIILVSTSILLIKNV